jgi:hypothetical protein
MPDVREVYEMVTKQKPPEPGALERQQKRQVRTARNRKFGSFAVAAAIGVAALVVVIQVRDEGNGTRSGDQPNDGSTIPTVEPVPALSAAGDVDPGRHIFSSSDPAFDASHRITIDVVDGYGAFDGAAVLTDGGSVSTLAISAVWADPCQWQGSLLDRSAMASTDAVVAALASQAGLRVSTPTAVTVGGFDATYMERRVPARIDTDTCDRGDNGGEFRVYRSPEFGERILQSGDRQLLWIVDVDGVPLVIDATHNPVASEEVRAEQLQMVESIQIEPVN